jgi:hypothetical protein
LSTAEVAEGWTNFVRFPAEMEKSCQWMMALSLPCVIESVVPARSKVAVPEMSCSPEGFPAARKDAMIVVSSADAKIIRRVFRAWVFKSATGGGCANGMGFVDH